jgi:predicted esterase
LGLLAPAVSSPARADDAPSREPSAGAAEHEASPWCAEELIALSEGVCAVVPPKVGEPRTVVVFLHGVVKPGTNWQWAQQRALARAAHEHGFVGVMPRGRRGYGPKGMKDWWTWPTSVAGQRAVEEELLTEWTMAEHALTGALRAPFARRFVFGFSNGAYYASSLALRGRFEADGFGVFAGGSSSGHLAVGAREVQRRAPVYVGYGDRDGTAKRDAQRFGATLRELHWPSRVVGRPRVGHTMTDSMVAEALEFFAANAPDGG